MFDVVPNRKEIDHSPYVGMDVPCSALERVVTVDGKVEPTEFTHTSAPVATRNVTPVSLSTA